MSIRRFPTPEHLSPGYFALVMGTGILSVGMDQRGWQAASLVFLVLAAISYLVLVVLNVWRGLAYREAFAADLQDPRKAFLIFTFVAATDVVAAALAGQEQFVPAAVLLVIGTVSWVLLGYAVPWAAVLGRTERPVTKFANGSWFVCVVGAQSVAVVAATLEPQFRGADNSLSILAVLAWSVGFLLYAVVGMLVLLRMLTFPLDAREFDPPYWVSMGAIAITVVAGARIVEMASTPMVDAVRALIAGLSVVLWMFATWLIPVLAAVGIWRHAIKKVPLRYQPTLWSMVFPLGMYAVAGMYLGRANHLPLVEQIGEAWIWVGLTAWTATALAMVRSWVVRSAAAPRRAPAVSGPPRPRN